MIWTLYNLAKNPSVCQRLEAEVDSVLKDDEEITASTLALLTYTEAVLKESLRLDQPVPFVVRKAVKDNVLVASDGTQIHVKKGTDIMVNIFMLQQFVALPLICFFFCLEILLFTISQLRTILGRTIQIQSIEI